MSAQFDSVLQEGRSFPPPEAFRKQATISGIAQYNALCEEAARDVGATVFLVPADNCAEALGSAPEGLTLARVSTLDEAVAVLDAVRSGGTPASC